MPILPVGPTPRLSWPPVPSGGEEAAGAPSEDSFSSTLVDEDHPVVSFLREAGLRQYAEILLQSGFDDMETLLDIEDVDMKDLGIPRGHAVKLRRRLREYRSPAPAPVVATYRGVSATSRYTPPTHKMTNAVERSWEHVQSVGLEATSELLYRSFFELAPEMVEFFPPEVRKRHREFPGDDAEEADIYDSPGLRKLFAKILHAVGAAVAGLHDINRLVPTLTQLGERHAAIGIMEAHYHLLGKAVMSTLKSALGELFVPEVEFAWTMVYSFISAIMMGACGGTKRADAPRPSLPAVGRDVTGGREVYRIEKHLQRAIFGDVYEAVGLSSGRSFAVKTLDRETVQRFSNMQQEDHQFCESPLCEVRYVEMMRGLEHVAQLEDHFGDQYYHFVVSELATGGDLLEALRLRPGGFNEQHAQQLMREACKGLASLHQRGLAMQDVSIENMLLHVLEDGQWQVRICDPGQAVPFTVDPVTGEEMPVPFQGFVAKEFRPPELYTKDPYMASKVDSWCLGWSTFYLLAAQPLFHSADVGEEDPDYGLFRSRSFQRLFQLKGWRSSLSPQAKDFILAFMHLDPAQRMSAKQALRHPWLMDGLPEAPSALQRARQMKAYNLEVDVTKPGRYEGLTGLENLVSEDYQGDGGDHTGSSPRLSGQTPTLLRRLQIKSRTLPSSKEQKPLLAMARTSDQNIMGRRQLEAAASRP